MSTLPNPHVAEDRWLTLGSTTAPLPERLLLWHAQGKVLLITGAGTSFDSGLPGFRDLVLRTYELVDPAVHSVIGRLTPKQRVLPPTASSSLNSKQLAEVKRFLDGDFDVVLGMLERRMDGPNATDGKVRQRIAHILRTVPRPGGKTRAPRPSRTHRAILQLADRDVSTTVATTNFDLLLEAAARTLSRKIPSFSLGEIPRPGRGKHFEGVLHIHGALARTSGSYGDMIVTDQDFGEFYLRRRIVPDFIYDAARLFHLVLVGYSANDAPMRYLLNAVAADGSRFDDLKERFAFIGMPSVTDDSLVEDWKGRGITPIPYKTTSDHRMLGNTLVKWAQFSMMFRDSAQVDTFVKRLTRRARASTSDEEKDLFDHVIRRSAPAERARITRVISQARADIDWFNAIHIIGQGLPRV